MGNEINNLTISIEEKEMYDEYIRNYLPHLTWPYINKMFPGFSQLEKSDQAAYMIQIIAESYCYDEPFLVENKTKAWKLA